MWSGKTRMAECNGPIKVRYPHTVMLGKAKRAESKESVGGGLPPGKPEGPHRGPRGPELNHVGQKAETPVGGPDGTPSSPGSSRKRGAQGAQRRTLRPPSGDQRPWSTA